MSFISGAVNKRDWNLLLGEQSSAAPIGFHSFTAVTTPLTAPTVYSGYQGTPYRYLAPIGPALTARQQWQASVHSFGVIDFDGYYAGPFGPLVSGFSINQLGPYLNVPAVGSAIKVNISCPDYMLPDNGVGDGVFSTTAITSTYQLGLCLGNGPNGLGNTTLTLVPSVPITAFGVYITDYGDTDDLCTVRLHKVSGAVNDYVVPVNRIPLNDFDQLYFWGFIDSDFYNKIELIFGSPTVYGSLIGYDDMCFGFI